HEMFCISSNSSNNDNDIEKVENMKKVSLIESIDMKMNLQK
ncbi:40369_t:CDS:1, partial [Gigaspora margarita]